MSSSRPSSAHASRTRSLSPGPGVPHSPLHSPRPSSSRLHASSSLSPVPSYPLASSRSTSPSRSTPTSRRASYSRCHNITPFSGHRPRTSSVNLSPPPEKDDQVNLFERDVEYRSDHILTPHEAIDVTVPHVLDEAAAYLVSHTPPVSPPAQSYDLASKRLDCLSPPQTSSSNTTRHNTLTSEPNSTCSPLSSEILTPATSPSPHLIPQEASLTVDSLNGNNAHTITTPTTKNNSNKELPITANAMLSMKHCSLPNEESHENDADSELDPDNNVESSDHDDLYQHHNYRRSISGGAGPEQQQHRNDIRNYDSDDHRRRNLDKPVSIHSKPSSPSPLQRDVKPHPGLGIQSDSATQSPEKSQRRLSFMSYVDILKAENAEKEREKEERAAFNAAIGTLFVGSSPAKPGGGSGSRSPSSPSRARSYYNTNSPIITSPMSSSTKTTSSPTPTPLIWPPTASISSSGSYSKDNASDGEDIDAEFIEHQAPGGALETLSTSLWDALPIDNDSNNGSTSFSAQHSPNPSSSGAEKTVATS